MWLKFGVAKLLCIYIGLTKFEENPEGSSCFCVDLTWNDPIIFKLDMLDITQEDPFCSITLEDAVRLQAAN